MPTDNAPEFTAEDLALLKDEGDTFAQEREDDGDGDLSNSPFDLDAYRSSYSKGFIDDSYLAALNLNEHEIAYVTAEETETPEKSEPSVGMTLDEIQALRKSDPKRYWSDSVQAREKELVDAQEQRTTDREKAGRAATGEQLRAIDDELDEIRALRGQDRRKYSKLQDRELELFEAKALLEQQALVGAEINVSEFDPDLAADWEQSGGIQHNLSQYMAATDAVLGELPEEEHAGIESAVSELPYEIRRTVVRHLAAAPGKGGAQATLDAIESDLTPEEQEIAAEWLEGQSVAFKNALRAGLGRRR